jgi:predicted transcriptional regulator
MARTASEENLTKLFGSVSRARILVLFFAHMSRKFYQREIMYETGLSLQPVQRELVNLVELGILRKQETPNRVYYEINQESSLFKPLAGICKSAPNQKD